MKAIISTIEEEFQKARKPGSKDLKSRKRKMTALDKQSRRVDRAFMKLNTKLKPTKEINVWRGSGMTVVYDKKLGRKVSIPD